MIDHLDHLVLTVRSISTTVDFYTRILGFEARENNNRWSLHFGQQKLNLHQSDHTFEPKAAHPTPGSADLCFIADISIEALQQHLAARNIAIELGPVARHGALGSMTSLYLRDPDQNLIELSVYPH